MTVSCLDCQSVFRVDPAKVPATGVRARCSVCGGIIAIAGGTLPVTVTPVRPLAPVRPTPAVPMQSSAPERATPLRSTPYRPAASVSLTEAPPATTRGAGTGTAPAGVSRPPSAPSGVSRLRTPHLGTPIRTTPLSTSALGRATALQTSATTPAAAAAAVAPQAIGGGTPSGTPAHIAMASATATAPGATMGTPAEGRRPINPFLRADPAQRARRLARALVSDLVAYHPQKREEGLRDGTLRQLFREEIKKSYEEYVEQVGRDAAEGAPYFQEALNEILADGRRLF